MEVAVSIGTFRLFVERDEVCMIVPRLSGSKSSEAAELPRTLEE